MLPRKEVKLLIPRLFGDIQFTVSAVFDQDHKHSESTDQWYLQSQISTVVNAQVSLYVFRTHQTISHGRNSNNNLDLDLDLDHDHNHQKFNSDQNATTSPLPNPNRQDNNKPPNNSNAPRSTHFSAQNRVFPGHLLATPRTAPPTRTNSHKPSPGSTRSHPDIYRPQWRGYQIDRSPFPRGHQ